MICLICQKEVLGWSWTDTHGVAQCYNCGAPYRLYHYEGEDENRKRVEKPPELCVKEKYIPLLRTYHEQKHTMIPSGFSFPGGQELASNWDKVEFNQWWKENAKP